MSWRGRRRRAPAAVTRTRHKLRPARIALAILLAYCILALVQQQLALHRLGRQARLLDAQIHDLAEENRLLEQKVTLLHSEWYIEQLAREYLGLVREGEILYLNPRPRVP